MSGEPSQRSWGLDTVGVRCLVAAIVGIVAGVIATAFVGWQASILVGWDGAALCFLVWTWSKVGGLDAAGTKRHADIEDRSRGTAEGDVLAAGLALLEDERKFIDLARSPLFFGEEKTIIG